MSSMCERMMKPKSALSITTVLQCSDLLTGQIMYMYMDSGQVIITYNILFLPTLLIHNWTLEHLGMKSGLQPVSGNVQFYGCRQPRNNKQFQMNGAHNSKLVVKHDLNQFQLIHSNKL